MNDRDYISRIAGSKAIYHINRARVPFEEKLKIIIVLQKLDMEMSKENRARKTTRSFRKVWEVNLES